MPKNPEYLTQDATNLADRIRTLVLAFPGNLTEEQLTAIEDTVNLLEGTPIQNDEHEIVRDNGAILRNTLTALRQLLESKNHVLNESQLELIRQATLMLEFQLELIEDF